MSLTALILLLARACPGLGTAQNGTAPSLPQQENGDAEEDLGFSPGHSLSPGW